MRELLKRNDLSLILFGRYGKEPDLTRADKPLQASTELLKKINRIEARKFLGPLTWDQGLFKHAVTQRADLFILEGNVYNLSSWLITLVLRIRRKKVAFWGHGWKRPERGIKLAVRKVFYNLADAHLVYGDSAKRYAGEVGLNAENFYPIYNSFTSRQQLSSNTSRSAVSEPSQLLTLIYSGRLTRRHKVEDILKLVLHLRASRKMNIKLLVVGDGPEFEKLQTLARTDKAAVEFFGSVYSEAELRAIYNRADYAISPGASGLNVIQSLCFNVPVIAASGNPNSGPELEAIQDGVTGYLYPADDPESLATLLSKATGEEFVQAREDLARQGFNLVEQRYTAEQHASAFSDAAHSILSKSERR